MGHDVDGECVCVAGHTPVPQELHIHHVVPLSWGGGDSAGNTVWLCPTSHQNCHELLRAWEKHEGEPPWDVRRRFNSYIRDLAERGWKER